MSLGTRYLLFMLSAAAVLVLSGACLGIAQAHAEPLSSMGSMAAEAPTPWAPILAACGVVTAVMGALMKFSWGTVTGSIEKLGGEMKGLATELKETRHAFNNKMYEVSMQTERNKMKLEEHSEALSIIRRIDAVLQKVV